MTTLAERAHRTCSTLTSVSMPGQQPDSVPDWGNLSILHRNTLPPRSRFMTYNDKNDALSRNVDKAKSLCLNAARLRKGTTVHEFPVSILHSMMSSAGIYYKDMLNGGQNPPHPPYSENECGSYITTFNVPRGLADDRLRLRFEGVDSSYHVWLNGQEVGYSQGSRNASEFDVTSFVDTEGKNTLAVRVYQFCDGSYIEDQDQWWLSGIFRDVFLLGFPRDVHFEDLMVRTELDKNYDDAVLEVQVGITGEGAVKLELLDASYVTVTEAYKDAEGRGQQSLDFAVHVPNPKKWTAETPNLYELVLSINDKQYISTRVGFRKVEVKDGLFTVNGERVVFKGVNRHEHHPRFGRAVPRSFLKHDLELMKKHNINAIRTCHQPNNPELYEFADEMGFWIMDEADLECHGFEMVAGTALQNRDRGLHHEDQQPTTQGAERWLSDNPQWRGMFTRNWPHENMVLIHLDAYLDRAQNLVHRDKLHPCIVMWSLGNEAFYGQNHTAMAKWIHKFDPTRPVHYEPDYNADFVDLYSRMYASVDDIISFAKDKTTKKKPLVLCEYVHAMGTGPGGIKDYVDAFYNYPRLQGGWAWEWANHGLITQTENGVPYYGYGGDFGDVPNDYNFVMDGLLQSDHTPNSGLIEYKKALEPVQVVEVDDKRVAIINRLDFATLDHLTCRWTVEDELGPKVEYGRMAMPKGVPPGGTAHLLLPKPVSKLKGEAFVNLSFVLKEKTTWADAGYEMAWVQIPLSKPAITIPHVSTREHLLDVHKTATTLTVTGASYQWTTDLVRGTLVSIRKHGNELLAAPMGPSFYRALTDNDRPQDGRNWKDALLHLSTLQTQKATWQETKDGEVQVSIEQKFVPPGLSWSIDLDVTYTFSASGTLKVHVLGDPNGLHLPKTLPRIGFTLPLRKGMEKLEWFGRGPGESYKDMKLSQKVGKHSVSSVDELWTAPEFPQECSNRTDTRWLAISDGETKLTAQFYAVESEERRELFDFMACHYDVNDIDAAQHPYELEEKRKEHVILRLDADHHGLGTASCGPKTMEKYALKSEPFEFGLMLY
nr:beta-galactosidase [Quercus suber]